MSRCGDRTSTFNPSHSNNLLHGLNLLWRRQLFCSVTLVAQGQQFHCHKAVLASCSQSDPSSPALVAATPNPGTEDRLGLGAPPKEQQQEGLGTLSSSPTQDKLLASPRAINNLVTQSSSSIGLRLVLEFLYTANVTLSLDMEEEVLSVSKTLHIPQVTKPCVQFLNDQISVQNYKLVCKIAALHGLEETKKLVNEYLVEDVLLLNFKEMRTLLDSLPPPVVLELALFQMSLLWREPDLQPGPHEAHPLVPAPELVEKLQLVFMHTNPICQKLLLDAMKYHLMPSRQHCGQSLASR
uniref:BTB domain-containing protein n=1 Tax=Pelodiscus sinensis TaxID=13735 RepID=K7FZR1_PELSI